MNFAGTIAIVGNVCSAVGLVIINKKVAVVDGFKYMSVLGCLHFYSTFIACYVFLGLGLISYKPVSNYSSIFKIALGNLASVAFMNWSLVYNSVGFYQISKLACIPTTLLLETLLGCRQQNITFTLIFSLFLISLGMYFISVKEVSFTAEGLVYAALAVICTSLSQIFFGPLQRSLQLDSLQLLFHTSPWITCGSFISALCTENIQELVRLKVTYSFSIDITCSCVMAVVVNTSNYYVLAFASPLTYQIIGHVKTIIIIISGFLIFKNNFTLRILLGIILALIGVILYTEENRQQMIAKQKLVSVVISLNK